MKDKWRIQELLRNDTTSNDWRSRDDQASYHMSFVCDILWNLAYESPDKVSPIAVTTCWCFQWAWPSSRPSLRLRRYEGFNYFFLGFHDQIKVKEFLIGVVLTIGASPSRFFANFHRDDYFSSINEMKGSHLYPIPSGSLINPEDTWQFIHATTFNMV